MKLSQSCFVINAVVPFCSLFAPFTSACEKLPPLVVLRRVKRVCLSLCTLDFPLHTPTYPPHTPVILDNFTPTENAVLFFLAYLASTIEDLLAADVYVFYGHLLFNR
jgi:hypothetical protein